MRPGPSARDVLAPLLLARELSLYLLSFHAVTNPLLAWGATDLSPLAAAAAFLAAAQLGGRRLETAFSSLERRTRGRLRIVGGVLYTLVVLLGTVICLASSDPGVFFRAALVLGALQLAALVLASVDRGQLIAITNALVLVCLGALRGGGVAAAGTAGYVALLGGFLAFDHHARKLTSLTSRPTRLVAVAARRAAATALPVALCLSAALSLFPATPYALVRVVVEHPEARRAEITAAYARVLSLALLGGFITYGLSRLLRRGEPERAPTLEYLEAQTLSEERLPPPRPRGRATVTGMRGRIVELYVKVLALAVRRGLRRGPSHTAEEIRPRLAAPAEAVLELTRLFEKARYGGPEPNAADLAAARSAAAVVVGSLRRDHRQSRRGARATSH